jgi:hypothetical protein
MRPDASDLHRRGLGWRSDQSQLVTNFIGQCETETESLFTLLQLLLQYLPASCIHDIGVVDCKLDFL